MSLLIMSKLFYLLLFITIFYSCKSSKEKPIPFKDSIMKAYIKYTDSFAASDTECIAHQFMKAYQNNDSLRMKYDFERLKMNIREDQNSDIIGCLNLAKLNQPNLLEAYRISYTHPFYEEAISISIYHNSDSNWIDAITFQPCRFYDYEDGHKKENDTTKIIATKHLLISEDAWRQFTWGIESDFWGAKSYAYVVLDAAHINMEGYRKIENSNKNKLHYNKIFRSPPGHFYTIFKQLSDLAKVKMQESNTISSPSTSSITLVGWSL